MAREIIIHFLAAPQKYMTNRKQIKNKQRPVCQAIAFSEYDDDEEWCVHALCGQHYLTIGAALVNLHSYKAAVHGRNGIVLFYSQN